MIEISIHIFRKLTFFSQDIVFVELGFFQLINTFLYYIRDVGSLLHRTPARSTSSLWQSVTKKSEHSPWEVRVCLFLTDSAKCIRNAPALYVPLATVDPFLLAQFKIKLSPTNTKSTRKYRNESQKIKKSSSTKIHFLPAVNSVFVFWIRLVWDKNYSFR